MRSARSSRATWTIWRLATFSWSIRRRDSSPAENQTRMKVLGISGRYRDAAAAVAVDGQIIAAASEDCFTRVRGIGYTQTGGFPTSAVDACLRSAGLQLADVSRMVIVEDERPDQGNEPQPAKTPEAGKLTCVGIDALHADAL